MGPQGLNNAMSITPLASTSGCRLWRVDLDVVPAVEATACLSDDEWARAFRFVFARDRQRFIAAHAALRSLLAAHTGLGCAFLEFRTGAFGKPALVEPSGVAFNLSHSQSVALIAIDDGTAPAEIGVDVELLRPMPDAQALADNYFSPAERRALAALPATERDRAFLACWTRKEACLKASGLGLSVDTRSFEAGLAEDAREVVMPVDGGLLRLALASFDGGQGVVSATARVLSLQYTQEDNKESVPLGANEVCA
jgi:4'-phosphopantetheinyl transferase